MAEHADQLNELFAGSSPDGLPQDVMRELLSIMQLHAISPQELFYKWESYCLKMGAETVLNLDTARALKQDVQEGLERESRGKAQMRGSEKRNINSATPRVTAGNQDVFGMLDDLIPNTPNRNIHGPTGSSTKRKATFNTPSTSKISRGGNFSSPGELKTPSRVTESGGLGKPHFTPFSDRQNSGQVVETINSHLSAAQAPIAPFSESRIKLTANTEIKKFAYRPMAMKLSESSEILDDRIDEFVELVQKHHKLEDSAFGNAANQSTREIIAVGRIASDSLEGRLNTASLVLETSRRTGAGLRVPLKVDSLASVQFFPGQIVALRGINASREYFTVYEVLSMPLLPPPSSLPSQITSANERLDSIGGEQPLNIIVASGPFTADDNLAFEPLKTLCEKAAEQCADTLILTGPFIDLEHPLIASGDFELPELKGLDPDTATLSTLFRHCISRPLNHLASAVPNITIVLIPSVRDAVSKHVSWPQDVLSKRELGLPPKQAKVVPNPVTISLNEVVVGLCSSDVLSELRREEVLGGKPTEGNLLSRLPRYLVEQQHFSPVFPPSSRENLPKSGTGALPTGAMLDLRYLKLGEWWKVRPDVLITPSMLPPFVKVIESVLVINPGTLSKRRGPGTYTQVAMHPRQLTEEESGSQHVGHRVFERARVDITRI